MWQSPHKKLKIRTNRANAYPCQENVVCEENVNVVCGWLKWSVKQSRTWIHTAIPRTLQIWIDDIHTYKGWRIYRARACDSDLVNRDRCVQSVLSLLISITLPHVSLFQIGTSVITEPVNTRSSCSSPRYVLHGHFHPVIAIPLIRNSFYVCKGPQTGAICQLTHRMQLNLTSMVQIMTLQQLKSMHHGNIYSLMTLSSGPKLWIPPPMPKQAATICQS